MHITISPAAALLSQSHLSHNPVKKIFMFYLCFRGEDMWSDHDPICIKIVFMRGPVCISVHTETGNYLQDFCVSLCS